VPVGDPGTNTPEHAGCEPGEGYSNDEAHYLVPTREPGSLLSAGVPDMYQGYHFFITTLSSLSCCVLLIVFSLL
jgi:hypothetical protein